MLVACEFSGIVREAFRKKGWDAWSCDLIDTEQPGQHIIGDAIDTAYGQHWDMALAHPPCTYLANSSAKHLYRGMKKVNGPNPDRWRLMDDAAEFFRRLLNAPVRHTAIENPIMLGCAQEIIGVKPTQVVQPWMFGHTEVKATCLWLKNLPPLQPSNNVKEKTMALPYAERAKVHWAPPGPERWKMRSRTFQGLADAMAAQWTLAITGKESL